MENFTNYSIMLGITDRMSADEIESEISRYRKRYFELNGGFQELKHSIEFLDSNINGLKRMLKKRKDAELAANFRLKNEHILLLRSMDFKSFENGGDYVFLGVEGKRPFGNSGVESDVAEICGLDTEKDEGIIQQLLYELPFAVNYIMKLDILSLVS